MLTGAYHGHRYVLGSGQFLVDLGVGLGLFFRTFSDIDLIFFEMSVNRFFNCFGQMSQTFFLINNRFLGRCVHKIHMT